VSRLLITGGSSYLGRILTPLAQASHELLYTYFNDDAPVAGAEAARGCRLDTRDADGVIRLVADWRPTAIIHLAGSNRNPDMEAVIIAGAQAVTQAAATVGARLIHLSSDVIFDGRSGPYREADPPSPLHAYGRAKAEAEGIVAAYADAVIVRTSLIYSPARLDHSTDWIAAGLRAGRPVTLFADQWRNPIAAESLSAACLELVHSPFRGLLHVAGRQAMSRAEFGLRLLDWWGIEQRETLRIGHSGPEWPRDCRLDISLAQSLLVTPLPGVDEVLGRGGSFGAVRPA
jgi:dTDP-4-dehydrorhamnose reductase